MGKEAGTYAVKSPPWSMNLSNTSAVNSPASARTHFLIHRWNATRLISYIPHPKTERLTRSLVTQRHTTLRRPLIAQAEMQKVVRGFRDNVVEQLERDTAFRLGIDGDVEADAGVGHVGVCVGLWYEGGKVECADRRDL